MRFFSLLFFIFSFTLKSFSQCDECIIPIISKGEFSDGKCRYLIDSVTAQKIYTSPEFEAEFPGGISALEKFIKNNVVYPNNKAESFYTKYFIQVSINSEGKIKYIKIIRGSGIDKYDQIIINLISIMPNWLPAKCNGIFVSSILIIPIKLNF